ncbi:Similar to 60S ribosomal protein L11-B; acc. no. Q3E757 [Pyronema omphalodes CBS 100304]|uniref:Similar to 60S ribosomal protein L11-B acc. no. Q3E757 n=1 Tax=Pyronema omphalodes (strain CBS 100304) TaxID=1076935 RepID=U4LE88_PYROM|nr:Similar to 60S ribosomal protein L11-B; acc. no. Q3E757 [Pyronema omphalodes CBS 100304]
MVSGSTVLSVKTCDVTDFRNEQVADELTQLQPNARTSNEKLVLNISIGESGHRLTRMVEVLGQLYGQTRSTVKLATPSEPSISVHVTIRGSKADEILECGLKVRSMNYGSVSSTTPGIGIYGMDLYVIMSHPGLHVARRRRRYKSTVSHSHKIAAADTIKWFKAKYDAIVL